MAQLASLSMLVITAVTLFVGVRLLWVAKRTRGVPEALFGGTFIAGGIGSAAAVLGQRLLWTEPGTLATSMNVICALLVLAANALLLFCLRRLFRPDSGIALTFCIAAILLGGVGLGLRVAGGDFAPVRPRIDSSGQALFLATRIATYLWAAVESLRYTQMLRRRLRLGLADPVVAGQIALYGCSAVLMLGLLGTIAGTSFGLGRHPLELPWATGLITAIVLGVSCAMWFAFLPPAFWQRRLRRRTAAPA